MAGNVSKFRAGSKLLAIAIAAALIAACGKSDDQAAKTVAQPGKTDAAKPADAATAAAPAPDQGPAAPAPLKSLSVSELLKRASSALVDSRFVAPPGNNAAEFYLAVLDKDSNNNAARDGLREMFPMATGAIEQQINAGQLDEGKRAIELMGKADPNNYALTILRGKLDLKRKQVETEKDKQAAQEKALAAAKAAATSAPATATTATPSPTTGAPVPATTTAAPAPPPAPVQQAPAPATVASAPAPAPAAATAAPASSGNGSAAKLVTRVNPVYPSDAARNRQEGWVEVAFTVGTDGKVKDASVVTATPPRIFNAAALRAVQGWTFQPRVENGRAAEQAIRTRIEFKL